MKVGLYCNNFSEINLEVSQRMLEILQLNKVPACIYLPLNKELKLSQEKTFNEEGIEDGDLDILISIGGDGTILSTISLIHGSDIPILGVNTGRLGFLTSISPEEFEQVLRQILANKYTIEKRALLKMTSTSLGDLSHSFALNEISVLKKDSSSMITINAEIDGQFLNTYWADGLIISTATGSTAYSLSCGGPIVEPGSGNIIITPIAPHNLNVRPLVIPDDKVISLTFESRSSDLLVAVDSTSRIISDEARLEIRKSDETIGLLRLEGYNYFDTLRKKLNWGLDQRN